MAEKLKYVEPAAYITKSMMEILERAEKKSSEPTEKQHIEKGDEPESAKKEGRCAIRID